MLCNKLLRFFLIALFSFVLFACKHKGSGYVYHDKWQINSFFNPNSLKGEPLEIKQVNYDHLTDTSFNAPVPVSHYELFRFDRSGNIILRNYHLDSQTYVVFSASRGSNGPDYETLKYDNASGSAPTSISKLITHRSGDNKFKTTRYFEGKYDSYHIITFLPGDTIVEEDWVNDKLSETTTRHYAKNKLRSEEINRKDSKIIERYYYSDRGYLDSVISFVDNMRSGSRVYQNNQYGDAVLYTETNTDSIRLRLHIKYQYDAKGNWKRQLTYVELGNLPGSVPDPRFPHYTLTVREIKY